MAEKMLVTQALDERDFIVKKISDKLCRARFIDTAKNNEERVYEARITKEQFSAKAKAAYQQIMDLISRFEKIEAGIINSNANTFIETSRGKMSVASAIVLRGRLRGTGTYEGLADFEQKLGQALQMQYEEAVQFAEERNQKLQDIAERMQQSVLDGCTQESEDRPLEVVEAYVRENTMELIDPLGIPETVEQLSERTDCLLRELDTRIKVSNAVTYIEI